MPDAFELEERIRRWRQELDATLAFSTGEIDELEDHLRFSYEAKLKNPATPEIAWQLATNDLGPASALAGEFAKEKLMPALCRLFVSWRRPTLLALLFGGTVYLFGQEMGSKSLAKTWISLAVVFLTTLSLLPGKALKNAVLVGVGIAFCLIPVLHFVFYNTITDRLIGPGWSDMAASFGWLPVSLGLLGLVFLPTWWRFRHLEKSSTMVAVAGTIILLLALAPFAGEATGNFSLSEIYTLPTASQMPFTGDAQIKYLNWKFVDLLIGSVYLTAGVLPLVLLAVSGLFVAIQQAFTQGLSSLRSKPPTIFPSTGDLPWMLAGACTGISWVLSHWLEISFSDTARATAKSIGETRLAYHGMEILVLISAVLYLICAHELSKRMRRASRVRLFYASLPLFIGLFVALGLPLLTPLLNLGAYRSRAEISDEPMWLSWLLELAVLFLMARYASALFKKYRRHECETSLCRYNEGHLVTFGLLTGLAIACSGLALWTAGLVIANESVVMIGALLAWGNSIRKMTPFHPADFLPKEHLTYWLCAGLIYLCGCLVVGLATIIIASALEFIRFNGFRLYRVRKARRHAPEFLALNE